LGKLLKIIHKRLGNTKSFLYIYYVINDEPLTPKCYGLLQN